MAYNRAKYAVDTEVGYWLLESELFSENRTGGFADFRLSQQVCSIDCGI